MSRDALVIGINEYSDLDLDDLENPANDAELIAQLLKTKGSFRVKHLLNAGFEELQDAIVQLFNPESDQLPETALLFFAGHNLTEGFIATSDSNKLNQAISFEWLSNLLQNSKIPQQILFIDACFSGKFLSYVKGSTTHDRCFITSARAHEEALDQGLLTQALLECLDYTKQPKDTPWVTNDNLKQLLDEYNKTAEGWQRFQILNTGQPIVLTNQAFEKKIYTGDCPYKGLNYFDNKPEDARYFKGRSKLTNELLEKIKETNFLAVLGASGNGKSSLVRAGLLYQLRQTQRWKILPVITPTAEPLKALDNVIKPAEQLSDFINQSEAKRIVLVIDQFEEVFTLCKHDDQRKQFFEILLEALDNADNKFCLIVVIRADFLDKCSNYIDLSNKIQEHQIIVTPMTQKELEEAIVKPTKLVGLQIEPKLVSEMLVDVKGASGSLPLLQYTLTELYKKCATDRLFSFSAYEELGKIKGTLEKRAYGIYKELSPTEQQLSKIIFLELIQILEDKYTKRQVAIKQLENLEGFEPVLVNQVVQKLVKANLVVTDKPKEEQVSVVNIAHEALIKHWKQLRSWLDENHESIKKQRSIEKDAEKWKDNDKSKNALLRGLNLDIAADYFKTHTEKVPLSSLAVDFVQRSIKRQRHYWMGVIGSVVGIILVLTGIAYYANEQRIVAEKQRIVADTQRVNAEIQASALSSEKLFKSNNQLDALLEGIKAGKELLKSQQQSMEIKPNIQNQVLLNLQKITHEITEVNRLEGHKSNVETVNFNTTGQLIATVSHYENIINLWDRNGNLIKKLDFKTGNEVGKNVIFSPNGKLIASDFSSNNNQLEIAKGVKIKLWHTDGSFFKILEDTIDSNMTTSQAFNYKRFLCNNILGNIAFSSSSKIIAVPTECGIVYLWNIKDNELFKKWKAHKYGVNNITFSPDGELIATASYGTVRLWTRDYRLLKTMKINIKNNSLFIYDMDFSPDSQMLAVAWLNSVQLWNREGNLLKTLSHEPFGLNTKTGQLQAISSVDFSPEGNSILVGSMDGDVKKFNIYNHNNVLLKHFKGHNNYVEDVNFSPDGQNIISADQDGIVKLWNLDGLNPLLINGHNTSISSVKFNHNGQMIGSISQTANNFKLWNRDGILIQNIKIPLEKQKKTPIAIGNNFYPNIVFNPNGKHIAVIGKTDIKNNNIKLFDYNGTLIKTFEVPPIHNWMNYPIMPVRNVNFIDSDNTIMVAGKGGTHFSSIEGTYSNKFVANIKVIDSYLPLNEFPIIGSEIAFSNDGKMLAAYRRVPEKYNEPTLEDSKNNEQYLKTVKYGHFITLQYKNNDSPTILRWSKDYDFDKNLVTNITFSPDNKMLAAVIDIKMVKIWNIDGSLYKTFKLDRIYDVNFSPDGKNIMVSGGNGIQIYNLNGNKIIEFGKENIQKTSIVSGIGINFELNKENIPFITNIIQESPAMNVGLKKLDKIISIDEKLTKNMRSNDVAKLLKGKENTNVDLKIYRKNIGTIKTSIIRKNVKFTETISIAYLSSKFSPNGKMIVAGGKYGILKVWNIKGEKLKDFKSHTDTVISVDFSNDNKTIVSGSYDKTIKVWDIENPNPIKTFIEHKLAVNSVSFSYDGKFIVSGSDDGTTKLWKIKENKSFKTIDSRSFYHDPSLDNTYVLTSVKFSHDGKKIAAFSVDGTVKIWDINGDFIKSLPLKPVLDFSQEFIKKPTIRKYAIAFTSDSKIIAFTELDNTVKLYKVDGTFLTTLKGHTSYVNDISFSPDNKIIVTASNDNNVKLWTIDGTLLTTLKGHQNYVWSVSFSPDGKMIASGSWDNTIKLWGLDGKELKTLQSKNHIYDVSFSPNPKDKVIIAASRDGTITLWDFNLNTLLVQGCDWVHSYLKNNSKIEEKYKHLCDDIEPSISLLEKQARYLVKAGDIKAAVTKFKKILKQNSKFKFTSEQKAQRLTTANKLFLEGENFAKLGKIKVAIYKFEKALKYDRNLKFQPQEKAQKLAIPFLIAEGEKLAKDGNIKDAVNNFKKALKWNSNLTFDPEKKAKRWAAISLVEQAENLTKARQIKKALITYTQAQKFDPKLNNNPFVIFNYAQLLYSVNKLVSALKVLQQLFKIEPEHAAAVSLYAYILEKQNKNIQALQWMKDHLDKNFSFEKKPIEDNWRFTYAKILANAKHFNKSIEQFQQLLSKHPKNTEVLYSLAILSLQTKQLQASKIYFMDFIKNGGQTDIGYYYLGSIAQTEKEPIKALSWYKKVDSGKNYLNAQIQIVRILSQQGKLDTALDHLHTISVDNNEDKLSLEQFEADLLVEHKRYDEAIAIYNSMLKSVPNDINRLYSRAMLAEQIGNIELFEQDLRRILKENPQQFEILNALGYGLIEHTNRYQEAYNLIKQALDLQPENPEVLDSMGWVLYKMGKYQDAIEYLRKSLDLQNSPEVAIHLGKAMWKGGKIRGEVEMLWEKAIKDFPEHEQLRYVLKNFMDSYFSE